MEIRLGTTAAVYASRTRRSVRRRFTGGRGRETINVASYNAGRAQYIKHRRKRTVGLRIMFGE